MEGSRVKGQGSRVKGRVGCPCVHVGCLLFCDLFFGRENPESSTSTIPSRLRFVMTTHQKCKSGTHDYGVILLASQSHAPKCLMSSSLLRRNDPIGLNLNYSSTITTFVLDSRPNQRPRKSNQYTGHQQLIRHIPIDVEGDVEATAWIYRSNVRC